MKATLSDLHHPKPHTDRMKISTQRWIDRWVGQLLCAGVSLWVRAFDALRTGAPTNSNPKNILVILLSEMGSIVLAGPMFAALRERYPGATLHVLQLKRNQEVAKLLQLAKVENFHALDDRSGLGLLGDIWRVRRAMRALPLDVVIDCELFSRISSLMSFVVGAPLRVGFTPHTQEGLYRGSHINCAIPYNPYQHISKQFLSLVDALAINAANAMPRNKTAPIREIPVETALGVDFSADELQRYQARLRADHPAVNGRKLVLLYAGGGLLPERAWPAAHYARVAHGLCEAGHAVGLIGLKEDAALAQDLQRQADSKFCVDLTGYTQSIRELLMLFHAAHLLITNDGGPGHFASLTPIRTFAFFGPETSKLYGPLGPRARTYESGIACSPCLSAYNHRQTFCDGDNQCLKRIAPDPVLADALAALA
jgi:ADP-heptose:LPS heptosyltransferase